MTVSRYSRIHDPKQGKVPTHANFETFNKDKQTLNKSAKQYVMSTSGHDLTKRFGGSPKEIGFDKSYITVGGIQVNTIITVFCNYVDRML